MGPELIGARGEIMLMVIGVSFPSSMGEFRLFIIVGPGLIGIGARGEIMLVVIGVPFPSSMNEFRLSTGPDVLKLQPLGLLLLL